MTKKKEPTTLKPKKSLLKTLTEHITLDFQNYRLAKKILQELGKKMARIMSNAVNSEICPFIKFIWEKHHPVVLVTIVWLIH